MKAITLNEGQKFNRWEVINSSPTTQYFGTNNRPVRCFLCKCECGVEKLVRGDYLTRGTSKSCGCLRSDRAKETGKKQKTIESYHNKVYGDCKRSAKHRGKEWSLTKKEHFDIITKPCYYCGEPPILRESNVGIPFSHWGIDRRDNSVGYTPNNSVSCCHICNTMKMDLSLNKFSEHIKKLSERSMEWI